MRPGKTPSRRAGRVPLAVTAVLLAACGGEPPEPVAGEPAAPMPADHPPLPAAPAARAASLTPGTVLARVGKDVITVGDLDAAIAAMPSPDRLEYSTPAMIRELLDSLVDRKLMAATARAEGLDRDPVMKAMLEEPPAGTTPEQILAGVWMESEFASAPAPTPADIDRYYREHPAEFTEPARVLVTRAMVADRAAAERLRGELIRGAVAEQLQSGPDQGVSAERIWLQDVPKKPEMTVVALGLDPGGVSPVLTTATGFAVLRADKREPARLRPFDEVRSGVQAKLQDAARRADAARVRQRLRKGVDVEIIEAALSFYLPPAPAAS